MYTYNMLLITHDESITLYVYVGSIFTVLQDYRRVPTFKISPITTEPEHAMHQMSSDVVCE